MAALQASLKCSSRRWRDGHFFNILHMDAYGVLRLAFEPDPNF